MKAILSVGLTSIQSLPTHRQNSTGRSLRSSVCNVPIFTTGHDCDRAQSSGRSAMNNLAHLLTFLCASFWFAAIRVYNGDTCDLI